MFSWQWWPWLFAISKLRRLRQKNRELKDKSGWDTNFNTTWATLYDLQETAGFLFPFPVTLVFFPFLATLSFSLQFSWCHKAQQRRCYAGQMQTNGPLLAFSRCAVSTLPLVEHLCLLKCFHPMTLPDSIFATQCRNFMHIHKLRTSVVQTWRSLLIAMEAVSLGCSSIVELLLPCPKFFLPERGARRAGMNGSSLIQVKPGEGVGDCSLT